MDLAEIIIRKLGLDPAEVQRGVGAVIGDIKTAKAEMNAMKSAFGNAMQHFDARLTRLESKIDYLIHIANHGKTNGASAENMEQDIDRRIPTGSDPGPDAH